MTVFDSSAIYKVIKSAKMAQLYGQYTSSLAFYELGNIIWKNSMVHKVYNQHEALELIASCGFVLEKMNLIDVDMENVYKIAAYHHISFYDAVYVCLAKELKFPLVTLDLKLTQKVVDVINVLSCDQFISH